MPQLVEVPALSPEIVELEARHAAVMHVSGLPAELPALLGEAFEATMGQVAASGGQVVGPPFARYFAFGERIEADAGFPYAGELVATERVHDVVLPAGRAVLATYVGSYEQIATAWGRVQAWIGEHQLTPTSAPWEAYLSGLEAPGLPVTQIVFPIR